MSSLYYPTSACGTGTVPNYYCNPCPTIEYGRVRSIAAIHQSYISTLMANPTSSTVWRTGINSGYIFVIWQTSGSYDNSTSTLPGFGDLVEMTGNTTHTVTTKDLNYIDNADFYNSISDSKEYYLCFRTSSAIHFSGAACSISSKAAIADDIQSIVGWEATFKWQYPSNPVPYTTPSGIFDQCYVNV